MILLILFLGLIGGLFSSVGVAASVLNFRGAWIVVNMVSFFVSAVMVSLAVSQLFGA